MIESKDLNRDVGFLRYTIPLNLKNLENREPAQGSMYRLVFESSLDGRTDGDRIRSTTHGVNLNLRHRWAPRIENRITSV